MYKQSLRTGIVATVTALTLTVVSPIAYAQSASEMSTPASVVQNGATSVQQQVVKNGQVSNTNAGTLDNAGRPIGDQAYFRAGSVTKTFIATTMLQLVDEGKINLDAPIDTYIPGKINSGDTITVRQLLNHTSGLQEYLPSMPLYNIASYPTTEDKFKEMLDAPYNTDQLVSYINSRPLAGAPGTKFSYANSNYVVAGVIIDQVTHKSYAKNVQERILEPLKMTHTFFPGTDQNLPEPAAHGYQKTEGGITDSKTGFFDMARYNGSQVNAAGELVSTTGDLNIFMKALTAGTLMSANSYSQMKTESPASPGYGLGLMIYATPCGEVVGHGGNIYGYATQMFARSDGTLQVSVSATEGTMDYLTITAESDKLAGQQLCK